MNLFYCPDLNEEHNMILLPEEESAHCARVLRLKEGTKVLITNGKGWMFEAEITTVHPKHTQAAILSKQYLPRSEKFRLHLAVAPTKNIGRYEWFLEKACEIGVDEITPLFCRHSERQKLNADRLERVLIAAMKQSQTATLPILNPSCALEKFVTQYAASQKFVGWCDHEIHDELYDLLSENGDVMILIGPEGDFSEEEIAMLKRNGYVPMRMGTQRLRTETAGMVACHTVNLKNRI